MTPLFFRGSILICEKVLSYNDFMDMTYSDFKRIESTYTFLENIKNGTEKTSESSKEVEKLSSLPKININDIDLPEVYKEIF